MPRRKEKNIYDFTEGNARRLNENVRRMYGDKRARKRDAEGKYAKDSYY
jgi:hypothetical protein